MSTTHSGARSVEFRPGDASPRWHRWVADHPIGGLLLIGVIATQIGTYCGYVFPAIGLPVLPWPLYNGILGSTIVDGFNATIVDETFAVSGESFWLGNGLHYINGIVFTLLFGVVFRPALRFAYNRVGHLLAGLTYGFILSVISIGLLVPYAYVANQGFGFFLFDGPDGWKLPFAVVLWHLIYGYFIGLLWQPADND